MSGFDLNEESYEKDYTRVAEGVWTVCEDHFHPGGFDGIPPCNNRGFIYEVSNAKTKKHLLMSGIPGKSEIDAVKKLEKDTGLELTLIVGSGDFHHVCYTYEASFEFPAYCRYCLPSNRLVFYNIQMSISYWLDAFPNVKVLQSGMKFPKTRNGKEILGNEKFKNRSS
jgi:hypothetical protein